MSKFCICTFDKMKNIYRCFFIIVRFIDLNRSAESNEENEVTNLHYARAITPKGVTSGGAYLRSLAPGLHSSEETLQRWRAVSDTVSI